MLIFLYSGSCRFNKCNKILFFNSGMIYEPPHDKTNKMACEPSKDSDLPGLLPGLIRVFAVCMKKAWALIYTVYEIPLYIRYMELRNEIHLYFSEKSDSSLLNAAVDSFIIWTVLLLDLV